MPDDFGWEAAASKLRYERLSQFIEVKTCEVREAALVSYPLHIQSGPGLGPLEQVRVRQGSAGT